MLKFNFLQRIFKPVPKVFPAQAESQAESTCRESIYASPQRGSFPPRLSAGPMPEAMPRQ